MEERRKGYVEMDKTIEQLGKDLAVLFERLDRFMEVTERYRGDLCGKLDRHRSELRDDIKILYGKLDNLPCDKRSGYYDSVSKQLMWLWGLFSVIVVGIVTTFFKR